MQNLIVTRHAMARMAQRGIQLKDVDLIALVGTQVDDGYLVRDKDCQSIEHAVKQLLQRIRRLQGKRLVVASGHIVTAFAASRRQRRGLLRYAYERDLG